MLTSFLEILSYIGLGAYLAGLYQVFLNLEPYCFYLPGGTGRYYRVHKNVTTTFDDIIGCQDIKAELRDHLDIFQRQATTVSGQPRGLTKGFYFTGPPGTGKTLMAKAVAGYAKIAFIEIFTNNLSACHVPTVIKTVIKHHSPCVIFIDESHDLFNNYSETILRQLDGFESLGWVVLIMAGAEPKSPLVRSGRLDKVITFAKPSATDRKIQLERILEKLGAADYREFLDQITAETAGLSQADLASLEREVEFMRLRQELHPARPEESAEPQTDPTLNHIKAILDRLTLGRNTTRTVLDPVQKEHLIYHEIGHCIAAYCLKGPKPTQLSIVPHGNVAGHVRLAISDQNIMTLTDYNRAILVTLASKVCEEEYLGQSSSLFQHDWTQIKELLEQMRACGLVGSNTYLDLSLDMDPPDGLAKPITRNKTGSKAALEKANKYLYNLLLAHSEHIVQLHDKLLHQDVLSYGEIVAIMGVQNLDIEKIPICFGCYDKSKVSKGDSSK